MCSAALEVERKSLAALEVGVEEAPIPDYYYWADLDIRRQSVPQHWRSRLHEHS